MQSGSYVKPSERDYYVKEIRFIPELWVLRNYNYRLAEGPTDNINRTYSRHSGIHKPRELLEDKRSDKDKVLEYCLDYLTFDLDKRFTKPL